MQEEDDIEAALAGQCGNWPRMANKYTDGDILALYAPLAAQSGLKPPPLLYLHDGAARKAFCCLFRGVPYIVVSSKHLPEKGERIFKALLAHELGHSTPRQIASKLKGHEVMKSARYNAQSESEWQIRCNTLDRFVAFNELDADRFASRLVPAADVADMIQEAWEDFLQNDKEERNKWYPQKSAEEAIQAFRKSLASDAISPQATDRVIVKRIQYLRGRGQALSPSR